MFRKMRRNPMQLLCEDQSIAILKKATSGVLAVYDGEYPYGVPLSYTMVGDKLYFHSANKGHKLDAITTNKKASFTVIDADEIVPEELTTYFRSVIVFGETRVLDSVEEKKEALMLLADKYSKGFEEKAEAEADELMKAVTIIEFQIEHISGKEAIELAKVRKAEGSENK